MASRTVHSHDWAAAQEATNDETATSSHAPSRDHHDHAATRKTRGRSMSLSFSWRHRPKSTFFHVGEDNAVNFRGLQLEQSRGGGFTDTDGDAEASDAVDYPKPDHPPKLKGFLRRASVSVKSGVKGFYNRRTSVPASLAHFDHYSGPSSYEGSTSSSHAAVTRPATSHSPWHRVRQVATFHRHSRIFHTDCDDQSLHHNPVEPLAFPIPGSREQPPIIPRNTGAAARQAAASAYKEQHVAGSTDTFSSHPSWLVPEEGLDDYESGIGIALTSSEAEAYVTSPEVDSDVDVGADGLLEDSDISRIDFVSQLPTELAIQVLSYLDAAALTHASRVSKRWNLVVDNQHIWRESFLREKTATYATSKGVQPGTGLGIPAVEPGSNWKEIYRAKDELDKRWKEGKARAVYLNGHSDSIYCVQFDESKIVTGSRDKTIRVWDMHTFECKLVIGPPDAINDPTLSLLYGEDGSPLHYAALPESDSSAAPGTNPPTRSHQSTPALVSFPVHHDASILCLQYDDDILVTGSSDSTCIVYDLHTDYRPVRRLCHHSAAVLDLVFDDKHIVTCSKDISICVWDRATGSLIRQLRGHAGPVNAVQMRGNTIVSCSGDFKVKLWNIDTGKNIREFTGHTKGLACCQFSEDGRYVASAGNDKVIRVWDANTGECVREMRAHDNLVRSLHVDSVSGRLISGSYDTDIKVFDMGSGRQLLDFPHWHSSWVLSTKSDYRRVVSTGQDPKILVMDFGAGVRGIEKLETRAPARSGPETIPALEGHPAQRGGCL